MAGSITSSKLAKQRTKAIMDALPQRVRNALRPGAKVTPQDFTGVLRAWRRLGKAAHALPTRARQALRTRFADTFVRLFAEMSFNPKDFGAASYSELADAYVSMLERTGFQRFGQKQLRGQRGGLAGELLELLVQNEGNLQKDLINMATGQRDLLNTVLTKLVDARGNKLSAPLKGKFGRVRKATDIAIVDRSGKTKLPPRKFFDLGYVSLFEHEGGATSPTIFSVLTETEIRMPAKARKAGKQIGRAQVRYDLAPGDRIRMTIEGFSQPVELSAEQIVFAPHAINRSLVTVSQTPHYRPSFTARGGYPEHFWRIGVAWRADEIWRLINETTR